MAVTIVAKTPPTGKVVGDQILLTDLFTFTESTYSDYTGSVVPASGVTFTGDHVVLAAAGSMAITLTNTTTSSITATVTVVVAAAPVVAAKTAPTGKHVNDTSLLTDLFTFTASAATDYNFTVAPSGAATFSATAATYKQSGGVAITATHKTKPAVTAYLTVSVAAAVASIIAKTAPTGLFAGSRVGFAEMFTYTNSTLSDYNYEITPIDNVAGDLSGIFINRPGDVTVVARYKPDASVTATIVLKAGKSKLFNVLHDFDVFNATIVASCSSGYVGKWKVQLSPDSIDWIDLVDFAEATKSGYTGINGIMPYARVIESTADATKEIAFYGFGCSLKEA